MDEVRTRCALASICAATLLPGCLRQNPGFDAEDLATDAATSAPATSTDASTSAPPLVTAGTSTTAPDPTTESGLTLGLEPTTGVTADIDTTGDPPAETSTLEAGPVSLTVTADIAVCVLLSHNGKSYLGPAMCEALSSAATTPGETGVMSLDTGLHEGGEGRPAHVFLRFQAPAAPVGTTLVGATLRLTVVDVSGAGGPESGTLRRAEAFDLETLESEPVPEAIAGLELDLGPSSPGQTLSTPLPLEAVPPGAALHLKLSPTSGDGVAFWNASAELTRRPSLELVFD